MACVTKTNVSEPKIERPAFEVTEGNTKNRRGFANVSVAATNNDIGLLSQPPALTSIDIEDAPNTTAAPARVYITGWSLYLLTFGLSLSLFLSGLETTIVSTSLVSITNGLGGFDQRDWVVVSYLLTYTGFLVIYAKFGDIFGRKFMLLVGLAFFTVFSILCGSISSMLDLIVLRAFQGIGGSGIYAMVTVINPEMVPKEKWGLYVALVSLVQVFSSVLGPILGGVINDGSSWRWVFLLNAPGGAIATALIVFLMPNHFPNQGDPAAAIRLRDKLTSNSTARLDLIGAFLLLAASILLAFGFEEAGTRYGWASPPIVSPLAIGVVSLFAFIAWEARVDRRHANMHVKEPVLPVHLMRNRLFIGLILGGLFTGPPFRTVMINLPQRYQAVQGDNAFEVGIRLLPMLLLAPVATAMAGYLISKLCVAPFYLLLSGTSLQLVGVGLASSRLGGDAAMYGYEAIMGFSFGLTLVTLIIFVPLVVKREDLGVGMAAVTQIRVLGGTIGLAISSTVLNNYASPRLASLLDAAQLQQISGSVAYINEVPASTRDAVREIYREGYSQQLTVMLCFSGAAFFCALLTWEQRPRDARAVQGFD